ncbi:MAG: diguanylate cyclase [Cycloclasticus sp. symbiont of Bathymodiolus heckerae]|nr:MAG: diguanylate cyclase [Cycloclasticus sp. symbiont of Bathymodiolus heckerae]
MEEDLETQVCMLQSHMDGMIQRAQKNEEMLKRVQSLEMRLLSLNSLRELIEHIHDDAKQVFKLESLALVLADENDEIKQFLTEDGFMFGDYQSVKLLSNIALFKEKFGLSQRILLGSFEKTLSQEFWPNESKAPQTVAVIPLLRRGVYLGCMIFGSDDEARFQVDMATYFLDRLGKVLSVCMENTLNYEQLRRSSLFDTLTGVNNRRFFEQRMDEEIHRSMRTGDSLSCLFVDIDFFKKVNDNFGHQVGDMALTHVAKQLRSQLRGNDVLARYGGEEFVVILPTASEKKGVEVAERMREAVAKAQLEIVGKHPLKLTVSIGVSTFIVDMPGASKAVDKAVLIGVADKALYLAKNSGRNLVMAGGEVMAVSAVKKKSA